MAKTAGSTRVLTILVLLVAAVGIIFAVVKFNNKEVVVLNKGEAAPAFTLQTLDGNQASLADYKGKVVLLNFWATWCEPCRDEMPALQQAYDKYKEQGLVVVAANLDENNITIKGFINQYQLNFPILIDKGREVALDRYKVGPIPTTFIIDKNGVLQSIEQTPLTLMMIEDKIKPLL